MIFQDNVIKEYLKNVYFFTGTPCGGKTTMTSDLCVKMEDGSLNIRVGAIIMKEDKFLMVENDRFDHMYSVGGRIKFGETAEEAVVREVYEETGVKMEVDKNGLYYYTYTSAFANENVIVNNGKEKPDKEQFPENGGLNIKKGQCKLLTADDQWVDYGTPDGQPAGFAYTASGTAFDTDYMEVKIGLKNAVKGTYQVDDGTVFHFTGETTVKVGDGLAGNKECKLTLTATSSDDITTSQTFTYKKTFEKTNTSFSSDSDGHTTAPIGGKYGTNPDLQLGKNKTIIKEIRFMLYMKKIVV